MQNAGIAALDLNWRYLAFDVHPEDLTAAIAGAKVMKFIGLNLTLPHKLLAVSMVDTLDEPARAWGAVNTIRFEGKDAAGAWRPVHLVPEAREIRSYGFNTDADAVIQALAEDLDFKVTGAKVLVLGVGGAGRVAALKLAAEGVSELFLINRTMKKAEAVVQEIRQRFPGVNATPGYPKNSVDLVLNATSVGLRPEDGLPWDERQFSLSNAAAVYDMIYRPIETSLLKKAKLAGCRTANGLSMLLHQGARALEIWTDQPAPLAVMRAALEKNLYG